MSVEDAIRKGVAAKALLESQDFIVAMDAVRLEAYKGFANSLPEAKEEREEHYYMLQATQKLKTNLEMLVANAQFEERKIEVEAAKKEAETINPDDED